MSNNVKLEALKEELTACEANYKELKDQELQDTGKSNKMSKLSTPTEMHTNTNTTDFMFAQIISSWQHSLSWRLMLNMAIESFGTRS